MSNKLSYSIGLDIGTASVGWACVTDDFRLMTYRGRPAFGAHIFDSADTAEARRLQRAMRRRYNRRVKRIQMLQELFAPLINDPGFFSLRDDEHTWRNNNQFENRTLSETLLNIGISKHEIHNNFPTIYHLRDHLIKSKEKHDLKLIYLAIHNLVKQRGHFLLGNLNWEERDASDFKEMLQEFFDKISEINELDNTLTNDELTLIEMEMKNRNKTFNDRSKEIGKIVPRELKEVGKLLVGLNAKYHNLFPNSENIEELKGKGIKLSDDPENFDLTPLDKVQHEVIELGQDIFLGVTLEELLGDSNYIAESKVKDFKKNKTQLKILKEYIHEGFGPEKYHEFFVTKRKVFKEYSDLPNKKNLNKLSYFDQYRLNKTQGKSKFDIELKKIMNELPQDERLVSLRNRIQKDYEKDNFLSFLNNVSNASIPYQNSLYEARNILMNQKKFHPEISDDLIENVNTLISFRIPYFVGPLAKDLDKSDFAWSQRHEDVSVNPFNFDKVIDRASSAEAFIRRMTNKCTYLLDEDVLPKHSLLYQEMELLNELNGVNLRTDIDKPGKEFRIPLVLRDKLIDYHFKFNKKVTHKSLKEAIFKHDTAYSSKDVYGTQKEEQFASSLSTYNDFREILGQEKLDDNLDAIEHIVFWLTVFNEKSIIRERIEDNFEFISEIEIDKILKLDYQGWGRISQKALKLDSDGESIIDLMRNDDYVFMEALTSTKHDFQERFKKLNNRNTGGQKITLNDIEEIKCSPALRKSIWSSIKIIEELIQIYGEPENIVIEFAREEQEKKRTTEWSEYWDNLVKDKKLQKLEDFSSMFQDIDEYGKDNLNHKIEKLRLYLLQGGKCLYTLENINLKSLLSQNNKDYHIDHILPRNFVKDDSFNNKALVTQRANSLKSGDKMPFKLIQEGGKFIKIKQYWDRLVELGMMTSSKYYRLMKEEFDDQDKEKFIARQLVETRQISVHLKTLLEERFNYKSKVVNIQPLRAGVVSEVRHKLNIPKIRNLNDHHHAIDAYLIVSTYVFGEHIKPGMFTFDMRKHKAKEKWKHSEVENTSVRTFNSELFLVSAMKKRQLKNDQTLETVFNRTIEKLIPIITKKPGSSEGAFYKQSIISPRELEAKYVSGKTKKYVHTEVKPSHVIFVEYLVKNKKGEISKKLNLIDVTNIEVANNDVTQDEFLMNKVRKLEKTGEIVRARVLLEIQKGDMIIFEGNPFYIVNSGELGNAKQLILPLDLQRELKSLMNPRELNNFNSDKSSKVFDEFASLVSAQFGHLLSTNEKTREKNINKIKGFYSQTEKNQNDFISSVNEVFRVTSPSATRSEKLGGRFRIASKKIIESGSYTSNSITGLIHRKPKQLIKYSEH